MQIRFSALIYFLLMSLLPPALAQSPSPLLPEKFTFPKSGLELERRTQAGSFFDVVGRRAAAVGYENRALEAWVYPLKIADDFRLSFKLEGYPLEFDGADLQVRINVRPEATTFTYSHAAFTVRETIYAPVDEAGLIILLDVESVMPLQIICSFRPSLRLMWPAGLMTGNLDWDKRERAYFVIEESRRFVGVIGSPAARDVSVMPYQEEPRDVPARFIVDVPAQALRTHFIPIVIAGSVEGRTQARATYQKLLGQIRPLYEANVAHYRRLQAETLSVTTPDERLNTAFAWAKVGVDKGLATNPLLGTGLLAGFRTSGNSERPGFAWFFGRDALWTSLAINSYGDFAATRAALDFLKKFQRADGKLPHEISQSASLIPWFTDYGYPWASADATPLYIVAHADYLRASGDRDFIRANWESLIKAYRFSAATDTDGNSLIENTKVGHGWVEGGRLYPPHEEIYQQGVWVEALRSLAEMAEALAADKRQPEDEQRRLSTLTAEARQQAERVREKIEQTYWIEAQQTYAFATNLPRGEPSDDEREEKDPARQARMRQLRELRLIDEVTVLPAVPMWWRVLDERRADQMLDRIGGAEMSADWGARIVSNQSLIYDPLSYHYGSVWPLFTGWASVAAYKYHRAHIGFDYLMANALLTYDNALGYVTELLSGDFNQAFGRSSHHQIWSCAMVISPVVRGMLGLEADALRNRFTFAPQLPAGWKQVSLDNFPVGQSRWRLELTTSPRNILARMPREARADDYVLGLIAERQSSPPPGSPLPETEITFAPSFPLDAEVHRVMVNGEETKFDLIRTRHDLSCRIKATVPTKALLIRIEYAPGTEVLVEHPAPRVGDRSHALKLLSAIPSEKELRLTVEGRGGEDYQLRVRSRKPVLKATGAMGMARGDGGMTQLRVALPPSERGGYVRQTIQLELGPAPK